MAAVARRWLRIRERLLEPLKAPDESGARAMPRLARELGERRRVAVGVVDPGGPEAAGIEDAALVGLEPGLVLLLEDHAPRRELVHRLLEVFDEPAGERRRRLAGVVWREIDEDPGPARAEG